MLKLVIREGIFYELAQMELFTTKLEMFANKVNVVSFDVVYFNSIHEKHQRHYSQYVNIL